MNRFFTAFLALGFFIVSTGVYAVGSRLACPADYSANVYDVTSDLDDGVGTLREAITLANQDGGPSLITFSGLGPGVHTIMVGNLTGGKTLPAVVEPLCIDGESAADWVGATETTRADLKIVIDGTNATMADTSFPLPADPQPFRPPFFGPLLNILANDTVVKGLSMGNYIVAGINNDCIVIGELANNADPGNFTYRPQYISIEGNHLGMDATGLIVTPVQASMSVGSADFVKIGGLDADGKRNVERNVLSGVSVFAVVNLGTAPESVHILGNYIGKDANNGNLPPIAIRHIQLVGMTLADGTFVQGKNHRIEGNIMFNPRQDHMFITQMDESIIRHNELIESVATAFSVGIEMVDSHRNIIDGNLIDLTPGSIVLFGCSQNQIVNNELTNSNGSGLFIGQLSDDNLIKGNVISGNGGNGIQLQTSYFDAIGSFGAPSNAGFIPLRGTVNNLITENTITDNALAGVLIASDLDDAVTAACQARPPFPDPDSNPFVPFSGGFWLCQNNQNGGAGLFNGEPSFYDGVVYDDQVDGNVKDIAIVKNSIYNNGELGIENTVASQELPPPGFFLWIFPDLDGVTPNDPLDADDGANGLQNYPVLENVSFNPAIAFMNATLNSTPNTTFRIDVYSNSAVDPSGHGEGESWMGTKVVNTDGAGDVSFSIPYNETKQNAYVFDGNDDTYITLTATVKENCNPNGVPGPCKYGSTSEFSKACKINKADMVNKNVVDCTLQ